MMRNSLPQFGFGCVNRMEEGQDVNVRSAYKNWPLNLILPFEKAMREWLTNYRI